MEVPLGRVAGRGSVSSRRVHLPIVVEQLFPASAIICLIVWTWNELFGLPQGPLLPFKKVGNEARLEPAADLWGLLWQRGSEAPSQLNGDVCRHKTKPGGIIPGWSRQPGLAWHHVRK